MHLASFSVAISFGLVGSLQLSAAYGSVILLQIWEKKIIFVRMPEIITMRKFILILLCCAVLAGCSSNAEVRTALLQADAYMQEAPDSALRILERIDPAGIRGKQVRAEYALLYSMALDKNYIFVESDSLIRIARDFYRHSGDLRRRFLSNYYYGLVLHNRNENSEALVNCLAIEKDALALNDPYYSGMLYNEISDIYTSQYDYVNSLKYARKSFENYCKAGKKHHSAYALYNIGDAYENLGQPDSAKRYFLSSLEISESLRDTAMVAYTLASLALAHMSDNDAEAAAAALWKIRSRWHTAWSHSEYALMATVHRKMNRPDSTLYYLKQAESLTPSDPLSQALLNNTAASVHFDNGAYKQAAEEYRHCALVQDSLCRSVLRQSYVSLHLDYIEQRQRVAESALLAANQRMRLIVALAVVSVLLIGYVAYINWRKRQRTEAYYLDAIEDIQDIQCATQILQLKLETSKESDAARMRKLIKERFGIVNELATTYYERQGPNEQKAIFNKVKALLNSYASDNKRKQEIEEVVNACYDNIMVKVRQELPALKEEELDLLRYVYAGFPLRVIGVFTGDSINYTAVKKSRLKAKIANSDAPSKDWFVEQMR